ncbi:MAG: hypothetical protein ACKVUS_05710 [Saprospiraceae bacterium]
MENYHEKVEGYLLGELSEHERAAFETRLQADAILAKSVEQHREMMYRLDALRMRAKVKSVLLETSSGGAKTTQIFASRSFWAMAATLVLLAAAVLFFRSPSTKTKSEVVGNQSPMVTPETSFENKNATQNETPAPQQSKPQTAKPIENTNKKSAQLLALARKFHIQPSQAFVRSAVEKEGGTSLKTPAQLAAEAFEQKNYRLAAKLLQEDKMVGADETTRFLRASARFQIGQFASAALDFDALRNSFQFKHEARWNFLLCQIAVGKTKLAKALLAEILADEDFPFHSRAVELNTALF